MSENNAAHASFSSPPPVLSVSTLNRLVRERLEAALPLCWVSGEISNLTYASSGHAYFSLKDAGAQVRCVMFRNRTQLLGWRLENGLHVEARVLPTFYEARGDFQLGVETVRKAGLGRLYEEFLQLRDKLETEGLFAREKKRALPTFPKCIGLVTSLQAAALKDVLITLRRRAPHVRLIIYPSLVQGENAARQLVQAVQLADARQECDVLILCRGGGSLEDLWAFNDEALARAIRACSIPLISGVGHETDVSIADWAADHRAPTPTAAAELAAPEREALLALLSQQYERLRRHLMRTYEASQQRLDHLALRLLPPAQLLARQQERLCDWRRRLAHAAQRTQGQQRHALAALAQRIFWARPDLPRLSNDLDALNFRLKRAGRQRMNDDAARLLRLAGSLKHLNPDAVLARGYSMVSDENGKILRSSASLTVGESVRIRFGTGEAEAAVTRVRR